MSTFTAYDGTDLAYQEVGAGAPLICLPGGPMQASAYLGELGGLTAHRQLVLLDLRGTGRSAVPDDLSSYRCDRQVDDLEALRERLDLDRIDLLAHSAGANLAVLYATRYPARVSRMALVTPSTYAVGIQPTGETRRAIARLREAEPWFPAAYAALERVTAGDGTDEDWTAIAPFWYGRWDRAAQSHQAAGAELTNQQAAGTYGAEGAFDPEVTRAALATLDAPVLFVAGEVDLGACPSVVAEYAELPLHATIIVQPGAGHCPWLDDADVFVSAAAKFFA